MKPIKKVFKRILYILFVIIAIPIISIYFTIRVIYNFWDSIYDIFSDLEDKILSINKITAKNLLNYGKIFFSKSR